MMLSEEILKALTPEIYQRFKFAVELKKWPNGDRLTPAQLETCMQAIIVYEEKHYQPEQRTGYVPAKTAPCDDQGDRPLTWKN